MWNRLFPLVSAEIQDFDLDRALNNGMLPRHYLAVNAKKRLQGYVGVYLKEEIMAESIVRNLPSFSRFLEAAALTSGEMVVYNNIANDCGVSAKTVKEYFSILVDTMLGSSLCLKMPILVSTMGLKSCPSNIFFLSYGAVKSSEQSIVL